MNLQHAERRRSGGPDSSLAFSLQALLLRHEEYAVHAAEERADLHKTVSELNVTNAGLTARNAELCEENSVLKSRIEELEGVVLEANQRNITLKEMLGDAEAEVQRLATFAKRTEALEAQLNALEAKQGKLQILLHTVECKDGREISSNGSRQSQIERQFDVLRERTSRTSLVTVPEDHAVVSKPIENLVEEEVKMSGVEQADNSQVTSKGSNVVSNFVEGLLSDNANMQLAMAKQGETLSKLQDEVGHLRERLSSQGHLETEGSMRRMSMTSERILGNGRGLDAEIAQKLQKPREVHVHHHYHGPPPSAIQPNVTLLGRSKSQSYAFAPGTRRFPVVVSSVLSNSAGQPSIPQRIPLQSISNNAVSNVNEPTTPVTTVKIYASKQAQCKTIRQSSNRLSASSTQTGHSLPVSSSPSSPQSPLFEHSPHGSEYSRPTSRGSSVVWHPKTAREGSTVMEDANSYEDKASSNLPSWNSREQCHPRAPPIQPYQSSGDDIPQHDKLDNTQTTKRPHHLRRTSSLLSISGMDIHTSFTAPFSPSSSLSSGSRCTWTSTVANRMPSPSACTLPPAVLSPVIATIAKSSSQGIQGSNVNEQHSAKQDPKAVMAAIPVAALSRSLLGRSTSIPEHDNKAVNKSKTRVSTTESPLVKLDDDVYSPLFDTLGKRVGGWLTGKFISNGNGDQIPGPETADPNGSTQRVSKAQKPVMGSRRAVSDDVSICARPGGKPDMLRSPSASSSSKKSKAAAAIDTPFSNPTPDGNKRLLESAGIDPVNGLPALRQVSGVKNPQLLGGVDVDALRECLMDLSDGSGGEGD